MILKVFFKKINKKNIILIYFQIKFILKNNLLLLNTPPTTQHVMHREHVMEQLGFISMLSFL
jgi:UDP-N-acetylglucosamine pyrophosphorylase